MWYYSCCKVDHRSEQFQLALKRKCTCTPNWYCDYCDDQKCPVCESTDFGVIGVDDNLINDLVAIHLVDRYDEVMGSLDLKQDTQQNSTEAEL